MPRGMLQIKEEMRAAYEAGDKETAYKLLDEYKQHDAARLRSLKNAAEQYSALDNESGLGKFHLGMAAGLVNVGRRAGQLLTPKSFESKLGVSDQDIESQSTTDRELASTLPGAAGRFVSEAALTAPVSGGAGAGLKTLLNATKLARTAGLGGLATKGAVTAAEGAAGSELTSGDAAEGALWNLGLGGALKLAGRVVNGAKSITPQARRLLDEGVELTPGQMNPKGFAAQMEQGAEHIPGVGAIVRQQREKLNTSGMRTLFEKEFGTKFADDANFDEMLRDTYKKLGQQYDAVRASAGPLKAGGGNTLEAEWARAVEDPNLLVSPDARTTTARWLRGQLDSLKTKAGLSGEDLLKIRSRIRDEIREAAASGKEAAAERAKILKSAEEALTTQIEASLPPKARELLQETDILYGRYKPLENAGFAAAARPEGVPTIGQLVGAVKQAAGQSRWAGRGAGRNQQFLEDLRDVSERTVRPTGAVVPTTVAAVAGSPALLLGMTQTGKRLYSGRTAAQRAAQRAHKAAMNTPGVRHLIEILRRGTAGALADHTGE